MWKMTTLTLAALAVVSPANAGDIQYQLSANVPVMCSVVEVRPIDLAGGRVEVQAVCNSETFRVQLGGDLAGRPMRSASVDNGMHTVFRDAITVRAMRPGSFRMTLDYGADLTDVRFASASIDAL